MQGRISNIVPIVLITVISVIAVEGAYQALDFFVLKPATVIQKNRVQKPQKEANIKDTQARKTDYRIILKRNLFGTSLINAKPEVEDTTPQTVANNSELGIVLMGTISGSDNNNRAIILTKKTRDQELFSTGEVVEGALIKDIQRGKLFLSINGKDEVLDMTEAAAMRPVYRAPRTPTSKKSARRIAPRAGTNPSSINTAPTPRRRVVRRPRATQNSARPIQQ
jgi:type II secretory pathway component PulC